MNADAVRAWWFHRQGLDGRLSGHSPAAILEQTGWARSVGGAAPYLTLFARGGIRREAADRAVADLEIHELPSARGCTYVVPAPDFALALHAGQGFLDADRKVAGKLGVTEAEVAKLREAVVRALGKAPLSPDELREAVGNAARSLGEEGKKKGMTTTLPLALGQLQATGDIRRVPINGRLDQQRYKYVAWKPNPLRGYKRSPEETYTELARRYFSWIGPATLAEFQTFSGLSVRANKAAVEPLKVVPVEPGDERLMLPADRDALDGFKAPKEAQYALVSNLDSILLLKRDIKALLAPGDEGKNVAGENGLAVAGGVKDLPNHAIVDRGRLVGIWEYDTAAGEIAWTSFIQPNQALRAAVGRTEEFIRTDLGDMRGFSLDSPKSREPRIQALRAMAAGR